MKFQKFHFVVGIIFLVIFLATGIYMKMHFPELYGGNEAIRFKFRANHIYILFGALLNLMASMVLKPQMKAFIEKMFVLGSRLLAVAPLLLTVAFFIEPLNIGPHRPVTLLGVSFALAGVVFQGLSLGCNRKEIAEL